jgi:DNA-binding NarL/FixJ family response regulator
MRLLALGKTVAESASLLAPCAGAISTNRARLLHKLGMKNIAQVVGAAFA